MYKCLTSDNSENLCRALVLSGRKEARAGGRRGKKERNPKDKEWVDLTFPLQAICWQIKALHPNPPRRAVHDWHAISGKTVYTGEVKAL